MSPDPSQIKETLTKYNQEQLLAFWDELDESQKEKTYFFLR